MEKQLNPDLEKGSAGNKIRLATLTGAAIALLFTATSCEDKSAYEKASDDYVDKKEIFEDSQKERDDAVTQVRSDSISYVDAKRKMKNTARKE